MKIPKLFGVVNISFEPLNHNVDKPNRFYKVDLKLTSLTGVNMDIQYPYMSDSELDNLINQITDVDICLYPYLKYAIGLEVVDE